MSKVLKLQLEGKKLFPETIIYEIFETNSSFHVKLHTTRRVKFLFFRRFLLINDESFILGGGLSCRQSL